MTEIIKEIEQDLEELKLVSENMPESSKEPFRRIMLRRVEDIRRKLDLLQKDLEYIQPEESFIKEETYPADMEESIRQDRNVNLRNVLSLNDSFRFSRELFENDKERMQSVLAKLETMHSLETVEAYLMEEKLDRENEAYSDLMSILEKYFS